MVSAASSGTLPVFTSSSQAEVSHSQAAQCVNRLGNAGHAPRRGSRAQGYAVCSADSAVVHISRARISNPMENNKDRPVKNIVIIYWVGKGQFKSAKQAAVVTKTLMQLSSRKCFFKDFFLLHSKKTFDNVGLCLTMKCVILLKEFGSFFP